jgi:N-acetylglucosamine kinase-like BadF-type ATPase
MNQLFLGVDCGATKTHYSLCDASGAPVAFIQRGTASHEQFDDGFAGAGRAMAAGLADLLAAAGTSAGRVLTPADITCSIFGLAGADLPWQHHRLEEIIRGLGFLRFRVVNDAFLGIKAGTQSGAGICSINGTGTTCAAISPSGRQLQIGGIGLISGDDGGGSYLAQWVCRLIYEALFRGGRPTAMAGMLFDALDIAGPEDFVERCHGGRIDSAAAVLIAFEAANAFDPEALALLDHVGTSLGRSVLAAASRLDFGSCPLVEVVLAGSVHVKAANPTLRQAFEATVRAGLGQRAAFHVLREPPVCGALVWALEDAGIPLDAAKRGRLMESLAPV